jgi:hypothetical protein
VGRHHGAAAAERSGARSPRFQTRCGFRLERARVDLEKFEPRFKFARVDEAPAPGSASGEIERVELTLDENKLGGGAPFIFSAHVHARRSLWGDDSITDPQWRYEISDERASWLKRNGRFEAQIAAFHFQSRMLEKLVARLEEALDDCLRKF